MSNNILDRLAEREFKTKKEFNKPSIKVLKLDGFDKSETAGNFLDCSDNFKSIGKEIKLRVIRIRYELFKTTDEFTYYSNEYESSSDNITVFQKKSNGNELPEIKKYTEGTPSQIKAKDATFKARFVLYAIYNGELVKIKFKGASLSGDNGLVEFKKQFSRTNPIYRYIITVSSNFIQKNRAVSYYYATFSNPVKADTDSDMSDVESYLNIIDGLNPTTESDGTSIPKSELDDELEIF